MSEKESLTGSWLKLAQCEQKVKARMVRLRTHTEAIDRELGDLGGNIFKEGIFPVMRDVLERLDRLESLNGLDRIQGRSVTPGKVADGAPAVKPVL